jgi:hypothetical protein
MKPNRYLFIIALLIFVQCKSPSEQINDAFKTVDESLVKSNQFLSDSIDSLYSSITSRRTKNIMLANKADSVLGALKDALRFIDSLRQFMQVLDTSGTNLQTASAILIESAAGDTLREKLLTVYNCSYSPLKDPRKKLSLDTILNSISEIRTKQDWKTLYFENTPTIAAITILRKFENDCKNAAIISLSDIKEQIANESSQ